MKRRPIILIMEDDPRWLKLLEQILKNADYEVLVAREPGEASEHIRTRYFHVASFDISIDNYNLQDTLPTPEATLQVGHNEAGMQFFRELVQSGTAGKAFRVVIVSGHGTRKHTQEAFRDLSLSDYIEKSDFNETLYLEAIQRALSDLKINFDLDVIWRNGGSTEDILIGKNILGERIRGNDGHRELRQRYAEEIEDLLCRLFPDKQAITLGSMSGGYSNAIVLNVEPYHANIGMSSSVIVKLDHFDEINIEHENYKQYVEGHLGGTFVTNILNSRRTTHFGGIIYFFLGQGGERLNDFRHFYQHASLEDIQKVLRAVFQVTCGNWYADRSVRQPHNLSHDYKQMLNMTEDKISAAFEQLKHVQGKNELTFNALSDSSRRFTNPLSLINRDLVETVYVCITHGDLNGQNILIDTQLNAWLIDFRRTGKGHILRDVAFLETFVRTQLLSEHEATLDERLHLEETLLKMQRYNEHGSMQNRLETTNAALQKAYQVTLMLRQMAYDLVRPNPVDTMRDYYIGLMYCGLNQIRHYSSPTVSREHGLLSASLIASRLQL